MENGTVTLSLIEAMTLVRLASREHARKQKRAAPAQGHSQASWGMELGAEAQLLDRLTREVQGGLA